MVFQSQLLRDQTPPAARKQTQTKFQHSNSPSYILPIILSLRLFFGPPNIRMAL